MMKTTKEIMKMELSSIKEAGVQYAHEFGYTPKFKTFRFRIESGYEWGHGYTDSAKADFFEKEVCPSVMKEMGWSFIAGHSGTAPMGRHDNEGFVYMHPMEITGYINPELISKLVNAFKKFGEEKVTVSSDVIWYFSVFDMKDKEVENYYYLHKDAFKNELKELILENARLRDNISKYIPLHYNKETKKYETERVYTSAGYNDSLLYRLFHIIAKAEDECSTHSDAYDFFCDVMDVMVNELFEEKFFKTVGRKPTTSYANLKYSC